nr:glycosyltransferase [Spiribacter sp. SSL99]
MPNQKVRILHTLGWVTGGGVERCRVMLAKGLRSEQYEHSLICQKADGPVHEILRDAGWSINEIGVAPSILSRMWHARAHSIARAFQPHIVHGAVYEGEALACGIGLRMPTVKVIMEETSDPVNRRWTGNALMRAMCLRADACIGVSPKVVDYLHNTLRIPERKVRLINNAVSEMPDPSEQRLAELRNMLGIDTNDIIIGSVGRVFDSHKRFSDLIRALVCIRFDQPKARLLIIGDGPDRVMLQKLAVELGLTDAIIFAGYQGEPRDLYHLMDVFVLASAHEAFGLVLVEAMLSGVPVVATEVGGIPFVLDHGKAGILVPSLQPREIADAVLFLLMDHEAAQSYRSAGLERARSAFSEDRYIKDIADLYAEALR